MYCDKSGHISNNQDKEPMESSNKALGGTTDPLVKLRLLCLSRGATGILGLGRAFRIMDSDGSQQLNKEEFFKGIQETGLDLSNEDAEHLFDRFDTDKTGLMDFDHFLNQMRPPMSDARRSLVEQAFKKLQKTDQGYVTVEDFRSLFSPTAHPRHVSGEDPADAIFNKFLAHFETEGNADGKVTLKDFMNYYSGVSVSIDKDGYFDQMMRQAYKL